MPHLQEQQTGIYCTEQRTRERSLDAERRKVGMVQETEGRQNTSVYAYVCARGGGVGVVDNKEQARCS